MSNPRRGLYRTGPAVPAPLRRRLAIIAPPSAILVPAILVPAIIADVAADEMESIKCRVKVNASKGDKFSFSRMKENGKWVTGCRFDSAQDVYEYIAATYPDNWRTEVKLLP